MKEKNFSNLCLQTISLQAERIENLVVQEEISTPNRGKHNPSTSKQLIKKAPTLSIQFIENTSLEREKTLKFFQRIL